MNCKILTMKRLLFFYVILSLCFASHAQVDTEFWFAVPKLCSHEHWPIRLVVTTFDEPATITVTKPAMGNSQVASFTVPANSSHAQVIVNNQSGFAGFECAHNATSNYGLHIQSTTKVTAYIAVQRNNSEIYALKGRNGLGTQFFVTMQFQYDNGNGVGTSSYAQARNSVEVIATEDNTHINITPSATCGTHVANVSFPITLNKGQVYCFASDSQLGNQHLCGSVITSDKPVVVDVTDDSVTPHSTPNQTDDAGGGNADLVADQLVPEPIAGGEYVVIPSPSAVNNNASSSSSTGSSVYLDYVFVFALEDSTVVKIYNSATNPPTIYNLDRGDKEKYHFANTNPVYIYATNEEMTALKPIFVFQVTGAGKEFGGTQLPHLQCTGSNIVGYTPLASEMGHNKQLYLTLLCEANATTGFQINGNANLISPSDWQTVPAAPYLKYCRKNVSNNFAPNMNTMIPFRVTNSLGKFHMGVFDINGTDPYDDCSISYFSDYSTSSKLYWDRTVMQTDYCEGDTIFFAFDTVDMAQLHVTGPNGFDDMTDPDFLADAVPAHTGMFTVTGFDSRYCSNKPYKDSIWINVHSALQTVIRDTICPGADYERYGFHEEPELTATPGLLRDSLRLQEPEYGCDSLLILELTVRDSVFTEYDMTSCKEYTWNGRTYSSSGDYRQTLTDANGCDSLVTLHLEVVEPKVEIVLSDDDLCTQGEMVLTAVSDYENFEWSTGESTPSITVTSPGLYSVTVTEEDCQAATRVTIPSCEFSIYMPNTITPSRADGLNDYLYIPGYLHGFISDFDIEIYDRWGELIYKTNDLNFRWAGENAHVSDVYVWVIRVKNLDGKPFVYKGTVTVL